MSYPDPPVIGECIACGGEIYAGDKHWEWPDGAMVHADGQVTEFRIRGRKCLTTCICACLMEDCLEEEAMEKLGARKVS